MHDRNQYTSLTAVRAGAQTVRRRVFPRGSRSTGDAKQLRPATRNLWPELRAEVLFDRLWATERKHLPDVDVAAARGWRDTRALKLSYQQADPASVLGVVEHGA